MSSKTIAVTAEANQIMKSLIADQQNIESGGNLFATEVDIFRLAVTWGLAHQDTLGDPAQYKSKPRETKWNKATLDPDGQLLWTVETLKSAKFEPLGPHETMLLMGEWGVRQLAHLIDDDQWATILAKLSE